MRKSRLISVFLLVCIMLTVTPLTTMAESYTVQSGDELWKIAQNYGVTVKVLAAANSLEDENMIMPGQKIAIPAGNETSKAKNVILLIGDGMGFGHLELGRLMEYGVNGQLHMESMDHTAFVKTNAYDNYVTDSAAAGTAIATGNKTLNGAIGVDADGNEVDSMADYFKNMGKSIGIISTNTVYDATPATFGASATSRNGKSEIVRDMLEEEWDVILGGGTKYFAPAKQDGVDYVEAYKAHDYTYVTTRNELNAVESADKLLGLFSYDYMSYKTDREELNSEEPSLKEMTSKALDLLAEDPDGFFMMSEGARIDHAAHAADGTGVWKELIEFDNTVQYCLEWAANRNDTLVIVTADHQTMAVAPSEGLNIEGLKNVQVSPEYMASKLVKTEDESKYTIASIKSIYEDYAGIVLSDEEALELQQALTMDMYPYKLGWEIGSVIAKKFGVAAMDPELRAYGGTGGHTAAWIPLFAEGPGAELFDGVYDNTELYGVIQQLVK